MPRRWRARAPAMRGPLWVTAYRQTAGRGRRGRIWVSEPGNLYASLLLIDACAADRAPELSFVSALALHDAVAELAPAWRARLAFKWPNDLLLDRAKLAGILVEGEVAAHGFATAIGIGVNCCRHPSDVPYAGDRSARLGRRSRAGGGVPQPVRDDAAAGCGNGTAARASPPSARDWLARAGGIGEPIRVRTAHDHLEGIFAALDPTGRLILAVPDGTTHVIGAGEVIPSLAEPPRLPDSVQ